VRDARKRGELARCPAPSSRARGLWDSLDAPTKRHEMFPACQSGREFYEELIEQQNLLPKFVAAFGFVNAKAPGFEADDFLAAAVAAEERAGGTAIVASGDRDSFQLASQRTTILYPSRGDRDDGCNSAASPARRSSADMGHSVKLCAQLGAKSVG
jgi:5'-3' exonuclease